jgi:uncharacterized protein (TIRG00374 family)
MTEKKSHLTGALTKLVISFGLLLFISSYLDFEKSLHLISGSNIFHIVLAFLILLIQSGFALLRWHRIVIKKGMYIPVSQIARYFWLGLFFNQILPSSIGGDAVRGYCLVRDGQTLGRATLSVLLDRLLGIMGLLSLIVLVAFQFANKINIPEVIWGAAFVFLAMICALFSVLFMDTFTAKLPNWSITKGLTTLSFDARRLLASKHGLILLVTSVLIHVLSILVVWVLSRSLMIEVDWTMLAIVVPIATLVMAVPVSIAGWGVREGVMVVGLGYAGVSGEEALALSILYGLMIAIIALPGGLWWAVGLNRHKQNLVK